MDVKQLIDDFLKNQTNEKFSDVIEGLMDSNVILVNTKLTGNLKKFDDNGVTPLVMSDSEKKNYIPLFTSNDEITAENIKNLDRTDYIFKELCNESIIDNNYIEGFVINPFTQGLKLPKPVIEIVYNYKNSDENIN
ncbi:MAG: SseB family protein [Acholeplasmatales bacterium]|nr:SseB family protein [Acholeplasmatales bacterium]